VCITEEYCKLTFGSVLQRTLHCYTIGTFFLFFLAGIPSVAILSNSYNVVVSGTVTLQCVVNANPIHTVVQWQKIVNGQITNINLGNDNRLSGSTVNSPSLTISQSQFADEGNYICTATNPVGTGTSQQTFLDVTGSMYKGTQSQFILFIPSGCLCLLSVVDFVPKIVPTPATL
jgi:hypothetical protein